MGQYSMGCALMVFSGRDKREISDHTACDKRKNPGTAALPKIAVPILRAPRLFGRKTFPRTFPPNLGNLRVDVDLNFF